MNEPRFKGDAAAQVVEACLREIGPNPRYGPHASEAWRLVPVVGTASAEQLAAERERSPMTEASDPGPVNRGGSSST